MTDTSALPKALADALAQQGYDTLTPVQQEMTRSDLIEHDLLVSAQTGSGKTVGFGLAMAPTLLGDASYLPAPQAPLALIIAPTRELALQVRREFEWLYKKTGAVLASCVGGMDMRTERRALERGAHIVVGTPGRLCDHIRRDSVDLSNIRAVVLDEADEMLDLGFAEDLEFILETAPADRRTLMFSATVPKGIEKLSKNFMREDAQRIRTASATPQHSDIEYRAMSTRPGTTESAVINTLRYYDSENAIVFANTRAMVSRLTARLSNRGFQVVALSGELSQQERSHALQAMRDGRARVCVATDVAARGIDLPKLDLVVHAELPNNSETLLHRSGRTGRAGRKGVSAMVVTNRDSKKADRLLRFAKVKAEWGAPPSAEEVREKDRARMLADPIWTDPIAEAQQDFVAQLTEKFSAEQLANAYLALYEAKNSAPEEIDAGPERKEREPFGPSAWVSLSIGHNDKAEPRWLLPMICRTGGVEKSAIGAIRITDTETFVEFKEEARTQFVDRVGPDGEMEQGILVKALDQAPNLPQRGPKPGAKPKRVWDKPARGPKSDHRPERKPRDPETHSEYKAKPKPKADGDRKPRHSKPDRDFGKRDAPKRGKPLGGKPQGDKPKGGKPKTARDGDFDWRAHKDDTRKEKKKAHRKGGATGGETKASVAARRGKPAPNKGGRGPDARPMRRK